MKRRTFGNRKRTLADRTQEAALYQVRAKEPLTREQMVKRFNLPLAVVERLFKAVEGGVG